MSQIQDHIDAFVTVLYDIVSDMLDIFIQTFESLLKLLDEQEASLKWAAVYYPRLYHCAKYSKRLRIKVKNYKKNIAAL